MKLTATQFVVSLILGASGIGAQPSTPIDFDTVIRFHFVPKITRELREEFQTFEDMEERNFELHHGSDGPLKYERYRLNPPSVNTLTTERDLNEAAHNLGLESPTPDQRRKIMIAYALSRILPAQMRAGDKHLKIRPARIRYALDYLIDTFRKAGPAQDFVALARAEWANLYIYRMAQLRLNLARTTPLTTAQLCDYVNEMGGSRIRIDWSFSHEDVLPFDPADLQPYFYLKDAPPSIVSLDNYSCDPQLAPDKEMGKLYEALQAALKAAIDPMQSIQLEGLYFYTKRSKGFKVNFKEIPYDLFQRWKDEDLSGWSTVEFPAPARPFASQLDIEELIFDILNPIYIEDKFKWSIIRYAEAATSEGRRKFRDAQDIEFREVKDYYEETLAKGPFEKRPLVISLVSGSLEYSDPSLDDRIDAIFAEELKAARSDLAPRATEVMKAAIDPEKKAIQNRERNSSLISLRLETFNKMMVRLADRLSLPASALRVESVSSLSGPWEKIVQDLGLGWVDPLTAYKDRFKETNRPQLFAVADPSLTIDSESGRRVLRVGAILSFEVPNLYELQLELKDFLAQKAEEDLFQWSYQEIFRDGFSLSPNGSTPWHHAVQDYGRKAEEFTPANSHKEILQMATVLYHLEVKKPKNGVERSYLADDFIPRRKKEDRGGFFGLFP